MISKSRSGGVLVAIVGGGTLGLGMQAIFFDTHPRPLNLIGAILAFSVGLPLFLVGGSIAGRTSQHTSTSTFRWGLKCSFITLALTSILFTASYALSSSLETGFWLMCIIPSIFGMLSKLRVSN